MAAPMSIVPPAMLSTVYSFLELYFDDGDEEMLLKYFLTTLAPLGLIGNTDQFPTTLPKVLRYAESVVQEYTSQDFRYHYRLSLDSFNMLFDKIQPHIISGNIGGYGAVEPRKMLLIFVWYMATQESMREIAHLFGISISTTHLIIMKVLDSLEEMADMFIIWPSFQSQDIISHGLQITANSPLGGVIGFIDGTHIRLNHRFNKDQDYICRKKFPSIQLQLVVDPNMRIINVNTGWPGCVNDGRVLVNSGIYQKAEQGELFGHEKYIIGDSAYPVKHWLIPVIKDNGRLSEKQKRFNQCVASMRQLVERTIGHLKGRFRRLRCLHVYNNETAVKIIAAACVLHNICISTNDQLDDFIENFNEQRPQNQIVPNDEDGVAFRNRLVELFD